MTIQEKLAQRIYELLPHKKELEFGCVVNNKKDSDSEIGIVCMTSLGLVHIIEKINDGETFWQKKEIKYEDVEIIGQPLRLADLLMAIEKVLNDNHICYVNSVGAVYVLDMNKSYQKQFEDTNYGEYNLSKDNILDQSDELCSMIYDMLK